MRNKWFCAVVMAVVALAFLSPVAAVDAKEKKALLDDSALTCTGSTVGKVIQKPGTTSVKVKITNGTPNTQRVVNEVCQTGTGCHAACGFTVLGTITTDGAGKAKKVFTRAIGDSVHYDICVGVSSCTGGNYWAGLFTSPNANGGAASAGDPTN